MTIQIYLDLQKSKFKMSETEGPQTKKPRHLDNPCEVDNTPTGSEALCCYAENILDEIAKPGAFASKRICGHKKCEFVGCNTRPCYNVPGETTARFCLQHKQPNMVDVKHKKCEFVGCDTRPTYNLPGETQGRFCLRHKQPNMVDVLNKTCEHVGCNTQPSYNFLGETQGRFCSQHKELNMVNVRSKTCEHVGCNTRPTYNFPGQTQARFCNKHKELNMVDVRHKMCEHVGCNIRASYGIPGKSVSRCAEHKEAGMMKKSKTRCNEQDCKEMAVYGITGPARCETHKQIEDVNFVERTCVECHLMEVLNDENKCNACASYKFKRLAKQREVEQYFRRNFFSEYPPSSIDKVPLSLKECGDLERPDFLWDSHPYRTVVTEVDEDQHQSYPCLCEQTRMINVSQSLGAPQTIYIRYNPDGFKSEHEKSRNWNTNKRLQKLAEWTKFLLTSKDIHFEGTIGVIYLFYDDYNSQNEIIQKLL